MFAIRNRTSALSSPLLLSAQPGVSFTTGSGLALETGLALDMSVRYAGARGRLSTQNLDLSSRTLAAGLHANIADYSCWNCVVGRPYRSEDGVLRAAAVDPLTGGSLMLDGLAGEWLSSAQDELAAAATFLRLAEELRHAGAPQHLIDRAVRSAREEVGHAAMCLERAAAHAGRPVALAGLPPQPRRFSSHTDLIRTLREEAREDGVDNEGRAATLAMRLAERAGLAEDARVHLQIAREEAGHARYAQDIVGWAV